MVVDKDDECARAGGYQEKNTNSIQSKTEVHELSKTKTEQFLQARCA
jgi:hypothetical protein